MGKNKVTKHNQSGPSKKSRTLKNIIMIRLRTGNYNSLDIRP